MNELLNKAIYIFGAGKIGKATLEFLHKDVEIKGVLDNRKKEIAFAGKKHAVMRPSAALPSEYAVVIISIMDYESAVQQLKAIGWKENQLYVSISWKIPFHQTNVPIMRWSQTSMYFPFL